LGRNLATLFVALTVTAVTVVAAERVVTRKTRELAFIATLAPDVVQSNSQLSLSVSVMPNKGVHVYAPGSTYRPIAIALDANPVLTTGKTTYPQSSIYFFKPLNERVPVYSEPFTLKVNVAVGTIPPGTSTLRVSGVVSYQACDDRVCFLPQSVPVAWTLRVK
jgi:hypothetical protein